MVGNEKKRYETCQEAGNERFRCWDEGGIEMKRDAQIPRDHVKNAAINKDRKWEVEAQEMHTDGGGAL